MRKKLSVINVLQQMLDRRRLLQGGTALGTAAALGGSRIPDILPQDTP